jgi:hypothetical protein
MIDQGLAIRTIDDVERIARIAVASGYTSCRKAEEAAMLIITGHELGLSPAQSLRGIYVVSGKPVLSADLMVAVVRRSGLCESWRTVESTATRCTITTRRKGETHDATRTWTMDDAKRAGITGKGTWSAYPAAMLRHRCAADLAREVFPDVLMGLYDPEELTTEDVQAAHVAAVRGEVNRRMEAGQSAESIESMMKAVIGHRSLPAPSTWAADLATCENLRDVRACYASHATPDTDTAAMRDDVRAWCAERGIIAAAAEVSSLLSTMPLGAVTALDEIIEDEEREMPDRIVGVARTIARECSEWDAHSTDTAKRIVARSYAHATGTDLRTAGAAIKRALDDEAQPAPADEVSAEVAAHIATKSTLPALTNSARKHGAEIAASAALLEVYATQKVAITKEPRDPQDTQSDADLAAERLDAARAWVRQTIGGAA